MARLLLWATHSTDDPTLAGHAFVVANAAREGGHEASIILSGEATTLMRDSVAAAVYPIGMAPFAELFAAAVQHGTPLYV